MASRTNEYNRLKELGSFDTFDPTRTNYSPQELEDYGTLLLLSKDDPDWNLTDPQREVVTALELIGEATEVEIGNQIDKSVEVTAELTVLSELQRVSSAYHDGDTYYALRSLDEPVRWLTEEKIAYRKAAEIYSSQQIDPSVTGETMYGRSYPNGGRKTYKRKLAR